MKDTIVEEIRKNREEIFEECGNDLEQLLVLLKKEENKNTHIVITHSDINLKKSA